MADEGVLEPLGVDDSAERVYRAVLAGRVTDSRSARDELGLDEVSARSSLETLRALGLVNRTSARGVFSAVDPRAALRVLADRRAAQLEGARSAILELGAIFAESRSSQDQDAQSRIVSGAESVGDWYYRLKIQATSEFSAFDRPPYISSANTALNRELLGRGVLVRAVYSIESFAKPGSWRAVKDLVARGERARVNARLPLKLVLADRSIALMSLNLSGEAPEALVTESPSVIETLSTLFESYWAASVSVPEDRDALTESGWPIHGSARTDGSIPTLAASDPGGVDRSPLVSRPPRADERDLISLIAAGVKDDAIALQLGYSSRTLRRRMQELFVELGASNRFGAGAAAARRGWL